MLRMDGNEQLVSRGDFVAKPAGCGIAHQFYSNGSEMLVILDGAQWKMKTLLCIPTKGCGWKNRAMNAASSGRRKGGHPTQTNHRSLASRKEKKV